MKLLANIFFIIISCPFLFSQWNIQAGYEHNLIRNKNFEELNHGNKYGFEGEYIFQKNIAISIGFNLAIVNREFTGLVSKYGFEYYEGRYQTLEFMNIGFGYQFRLNEKLFLVPKLRYSPTLVIKTETFSASKTVFIYSIGNDNTETEDPDIISTSMHDQVTDPILRESRNNNKRIFFPIIPYVSVDLRYLISNQLQAKITLGFSLDNGAVRSHYYNLGASLIFKLLSYEEE
jgi:hypothetical protein